MLIIAATCFQNVNAGWVKQNSNTLAWFRAVFFVNEKTGWIGGGNGTLLMTNDGGNSWKAAKKITGDTIKQIYFSDENNGWLLCERDIYTLGASSPSYLLKTSDGGADWEKVEFSDKGRVRIAKLFFAENDLGFAVGESGAIFVLQDDAKNWKQQPSPVRSLLLDGTFNDKRNGVLVGGGGSIFFTEDAGISWNQAFISSASKAKLNSVFFVNKNIGWIAGSEGRILQTVSGGKNWREQKTGTAVNLTDVFFKDTAHGWAIGDEGTILYSSTGGNVWSKVDLKIRHKLEKLFSNGRDIWAVGFGGTILRYDLLNQNTASKKDAPVLLKNVR